MEIVTKMSKNCKESTNLELSNGINETLNSKISKVYSVFDSAAEENLLNDCFLSFNGGKDCTVLLHLIQSYFVKNNEQNKFNTFRIIYIQPDKPFKEIEEFVNACEITYNVKIEKYRGKLKSVLEDICKKNPNFKAVVMGSRRSDPYCENLKTFHPTDAGWPKLMRINPLLDWTTTDIWNYIRCKNINYCSLYDDGYTSLGDITNTQKNPHLEYEDAESGEIRYYPAHKLLDDNLERAGRR